MSSRDKVNILMVDDQPAKLLSYEAILDDLGENLIRANSGQEALAELLKNDIAIVLMDVSMPEVDGFELAAMIRQHPRYQKTAIIFISAVRHTDFDRLKGYEVGAVDYIPIPVVPEILRAKVSVFADRYRKTRELEEFNQELERRVEARTAELAAAAAREREARVEAEAANAQLRALLALTDTALSHLAVDNLFPALLERVREVMDVDDLAILLLEEDGQTLTMRELRGPEKVAREQVRVPLGHGFAGRIAATRRPLIAEDLSTFPVVNPVLPERLSSAMGVPLEVDGRVLGVVHVGSIQPHVFTDSDVQLLERVAERIALAIERSRGYEAEQRARLAAETARREAEAALGRAQVSESRFRRVVDAKIIGIVVSDGKRAIEVNDAFLQMISYNRDDLVSQGADTYTVTAPEYRRATRRAFQEAQLHGACAPYEKEYVRPDGTRVPVLVGVVRLECEPLRFVSLVVDLTERKRLEREREAARANELAALEVSRQLDQFFAIAAHDIRTPVTAALGSMELAQQRFRRLVARVPALAPAPAGEQDGVGSNLVAGVSASLELANQSMERMARLTGRLFDVAHARSHTLVVQQEPSDLAVIVREQVAAERLAAPRRLLRLDVPDQPVPVLADADRLDQVLANYVTNALKYSADDQPIEVRLEVVGDVARVSVRDRGPGLPPEECERVWAPFHRAPGVAVQNSAGGASEGLGLGLSIGKTIIERHGGQVGVESMVGEGSTFWFSLPLAHPAG